MRRFRWCPMLYCATPANADTDIGPRMAPRLFILRFLMTTTTRPLPGITAGSLLAPISVALTSVSARRRPVATRIGGCGSRR